MEEKIHNTFINAWKPWSPDDDAKLVSLYNDDLCDIFEISKRPQREPGGIISRLIKNKCVSNRTLARLYKDIVAEKVQKRKIRNEEKRGKAVADGKVVAEVIRPALQNDITVTLYRGTYAEVQIELADIKRDMAGLRRGMSEIIDMLKAVYIFEDV